MNKGVFINLFLDTRFEKENNKYPVKLRVFTPSPRRQKLYKTIFEYTEKEFASIMTLKPRLEHQEARQDLDALKIHARETADLIIPFNFEQFERKLSLKKGENENVVYQYRLAVEKLKSNKCFSTASNYELSLKSLQDFIEHSRGTRPTHIDFKDITPDWLQKYQNYMVDTLKRSLTTVSMYLRALRTVYNSAITAKEIDKEFYPFGKGKYIVPGVKSVKKALSTEQLKKLFDAEPGSFEQTRAKDYFFFSFACNGMNVKDIALLRNKDLQDDKLVFYRAKTLNTSKQDLTPITVYLNDYSKSFIKNYRAEDKKPDSYIFPIISKEATDFENHRAIKNFTIGLNKAIKKLAEKEGLSKDISTYWARHSFSTAAIRGGASMEFIRESLGHSDLKTTLGYFAGFEDKDKKDFAQTIMNFESPAKPKEKKKSKKK